MRAGDAAAAVAAARDKGALFVALVTGSNWHHPHEISQRIGKQKETEKSRRESGRHDGKPVGCCTFLGGMMYFLYSEYGRGRQPRAKSEKVDDDGFSRGAW